MSKNGREHLQQVIERLLKSHQAKIVAAVAEGPDQAVEAIDALQGVLQLVRWDFCRVAVGDTSAALSSARYAGANLHEVYRAT